MHHLKKISGLFLTIGLLALSACGAGSAAKPTVDTAPIYTQLASTALAYQTQTALAMPTATSTPQVSPTPQGTDTPLITITPLPGTPSVTPPAVNTLQATSQASCDNMQYITDVNYLDGYAAAPGEVMGKTWKVKNLGPCTWNQDYVLAFGYGGEGTGWDTTRPVHLDNLVLPGETVEITVTLKTPTASGEYGAYFRLRNDNDFFFGPYLSILIKV